MKHCITTGQPQIWLVNRHFTEPTKPYWPARARAQMGSLEQATITNQEKSLRTNQYWFLWTPPTSCHLWLGLKQNQPIAFLSKTNKRVQLLGENLAMFGTKAMSSLRRTSGSTPILRLWEESFSSNSTEGTSDISLKDRAESLFCSWAQKSNRFHHVSTAEDVFFLSSTEVKYSDTSENIGLDQSQFKKS